MKVQKEIYSKISKQFRMDIEGGLFPVQNKLKDPVNCNLSELPLVQKRFDLSVYHLAYGTKPLRKSTIRRMLKRQNRINQKKAVKTIVLSPQEREKKAEKLNWVNSLLQKAKKENLEFLVEGPGNRLISKEKIIAKNTRRIRRIRNSRCAPSRHIQLTGYPNNQFFFKPQSLVGQTGTATRVVRTRNSPSIPLLVSPPAQPSTLKGHNNPIKGFGDDSQFPSLL